MSTTATLCILFGLAKATAGIIMWVCAGMKRKKWGEYNVA